MNADDEIRIRVFTRQRSGAMIATGFLAESAIEFVADGAEKAGHRGALSVAFSRLMNAKDMGILFTSLSNGGFNG
jgi:hypothetical protein